MRYFSLGLVFAALLQTGCASSPGYIVHTNDPAELVTFSNTSLQKLLGQNESAQQLAEDAEGILVFPRILKAGFTFGGQYGEGVLFENGEPDSYYNSLSASFGLQAGVQSFGYALIITNDTALDYIKESKGWEIGLGPSLVIANKGIGKSLTSTTVRSDIYAFVYDQKGLMAGSGLQGTKITPINPGGEYNGEDQ